MKAIGDFLERPFLYFYYALKERPFLYSLVIQGLCSLCTLCTTLFILAYSYITVVTILNKFKDSHVPIATLNEEG